MERIKMKEIFDWLRERCISGDKRIGRSSLSAFLEIINEAEAKWQEKEAEIRANVIDEFAERMQRKSDWIETYTRAFGHTGATIRETLKEVALQMKGEKE